MKKILVAVICVLATSVMAQPYYARGDFNGYSTGNQMTESSGVYSVLVGSMTSATFGQWKAAVSDWSFSKPDTGNSWYNPGAGTSLTFTFIPGAAGDGWLPDTNRVYITPAFVAASYTAVGDFNGWNQADAANHMKDDGTEAGDTSAGDGIYVINKVIAAAGTYGYKVALNDSWAQQIGSDGPSINAGTIPFTTTVASQTVRFFVDINKSVVKVDVIAPSSVDDWMMF